jgi:hypothetical protein
MLDKVLYCSGCKKYYAYEEQGLAYYTEYPTLDYSICWQVGCSGLVSLTPLQTSFNFWDKRA